jgi:long-chain acyl-CoA synthetase
MISSDPFSAATLPHVLRARAAERAEHTALSAGSEELTYAELSGLVGALAGRLVGLGVRTGDRVAIAGVNSPEWVVAFLATLEAGAIAVPLNHRLGRLELAAQLAQVGPKLVLHDQQCSDAIGSLAEASRRRIMDRDEPGPRSIWRAAPQALDPIEITPGAPALISFTSGSTGIPKGALISHGALVAAAAAYARTLGTSGSDRTLVLVPLFHNTGFCDQLAHMLLVGGVCDLLAEFGTSAARAALLRRPASYLIAVPGILRLLSVSEDAGEIFSRCGIACYGGSPMPQPWLTELASRWPSLRLYNCFGLTEFTSVSHMLEPADIAAHPGSVGRPVAGVEQRIVDATGRALPSGTAGELQLAGPTRMLRYWDAPGLTAFALDGRWLRTGDIGAVTKEGFLRLLGRASEVINRGGEKISPLQVEAALSLEPHIAEAAVIGAPHPIFGERVVAFVTLRGTTELEAEAVAGRLRERIADYAVPERFIVLDELPRNASGKTDRHGLRRCADRQFEEVSAP